jgi:hypothetical protein
MHRRSRTVPIALAFLSLGAAIGAGGLLATGVSAAPAPLVTNYPAYPAPGVAGAPDGCDANSFQGVRFTTGRGDSAADLQALPALRAGDEVTFSWTGLAPGCDEARAHATLVVMTSPTETFDPAETQRTVDYETAVGRAGEVTLVLPSLVGEGDSCRYHLDAVMGYALAVVGPSGSYYSAASRNDDDRSMLASARVGRYPTCIETVTTSSTSTTITPSTIADDVPPPVVTTLVALPTIVLPSTTTTVLADMSAEDLALPPAARAAPGIPNTGANTRATVSLGLTMLAVGAAVLAFVTLRLDRR